MSIDGCFDRTNLDMYSFYKGQRSGYVQGHTQGRNYGAAYHVANTNLGLVERVLDNPIDLTPNNHAEVVRLLTFVNNAIDVMKNNPGQDNWEITGLADRVSAIEGKLSQIATAKS